MLSHTLMMVVLVVLTAAGILAGALAVVLVRARAEAKRLLARFEANAVRLEARASVLHAGMLSEHARRLAELADSQPLQPGAYTSAEQHADALAEQQAVLAQTDAARDGLQDLLESLPDSFIALDREFRFTFLNKRAQELAGRREEDLFGKRLWDVFPERIGDEMYQALHRAMMGRTAVELETYHAGVDRWFNMRAFPTTDGLAVYFQDVTEKRHADELRIRLASIVESSDDAIISMDIDGTVQSWNNGAQMLYGYTCEEAIGRSLTMLAPDGRTEQMTDLLQRLREGVRIDPMETVRRRKDGSTVQVFLTVSSVRDASGRIIGASGIARDMSALKEAERAVRRTEDVLRFLADAGSSLAASLDLDATLERVAREAVPFFADYCIVDLIGEAGELARVALAHAHPAQQLLLDKMRAHPPKRGQHVLIDRVLESGQPEFSSEPAVVLMSADGRPPGFTELFFRELQPQAYMCVPLIAHEATLGVITFVYSTSDRKYVEGDVPLAMQIAARAATAIDNARLYREAEAANRAKSDFLAVMSHELRTPLNAIGGYAQLIELGLRGSVTEQQKEDLARIRRSQLHLLAMVNDVLNFVRLEAGHARFAITDVDVADALSAAVDMVAPQLHAQGLTFEQSYTPGLHVRTDREKLQQIALNLLSNAIKYTQPGGHVVLRSELRDGAVHIQVRDNGRGIPKEKLENIFEPFVRLDLGLTRTTQGTGLGLSISRDLARALTGELAAESELGLGSTFTLVLPAAVTVASAPDPQTELAATHAAPRGTESSRHDFR